MIGLSHLGGPIAGLALALLLVARTRRDRLAGLGFALFGTVVLGVSVAPHHHLLVLCGGLLLGCSLALGLAALFRSWPWLLPVLALACVPIRIGVHIGDSSSKLLVPLYVVIAGGVVLLGWDLLAGDETVRELRRVSTPLALFVAWTSVSILWTRDVNDGATELLAFYVPFTLLAICIARLPWHELGLRVLFLELLVMGIAFSVVGFYQYDTRDIFQNPKVITANAYAPFFRVNSVFWDPSIYGRFLVVAMLPALVLLARGRLPPGPRSGAGQAGASAPGRLRRAYAGWAPVAAAAALAVMWAGLLISFSQSSFAALLVVVAGAAFIYWRWRALVVIAVAAAVLAGIAVAQPKVRQQLQHHTIHGLNEASSGRASLVAVGIRIAEANPAKGVGVGGFKRAYAKRTHLPGKEPKTAASHNTPVTVAAESGLPGILLYLWLVVAVFRQAFRRRTSLALIGGIGVAAILCHSLFYNAFFEDPVTWALFGLAAIGAPRQFARVREPVPDVERTQVPA